MATVAFPNRFFKMAYEITRLCMRSDGTTGNTRTNHVVFQFAKIEHYLTTFQRHNSAKIYAKINSIPFPRQNISLQLQIQSRPYKSLTKESKMTYLIGNSKKSKDAT